MIASQALNSRLAEKYSSASVPTHRRAMITPLLHISPPFLVGIEAA